MPADGSPEFTPDTAPHSVKRNNYSDEVGSQKDRPKSRKVITVLAATGLVAGTLVASANQFEQNVMDPDFGKQVENSQPFDATLIHSEDNLKNKVPPVFREEPSNTSKELAPNELQARGINPNDPNVKVKEVYGQTYSSDSSRGSVLNEQTGKNHGVWGEIMVTDLKTGLDKPTGIFLSENFVSKNKVDISTGK